jgi:DNA-binding transcriptional regulator YiaG
MTYSAIPTGYVGARRIHRLKDHRLLRRLPWRAEDRQPILEALGSAQVPDEFDVRALRQREGLSRDDFAAIYGLSARAVQSWEQGQTPSKAARAYLAIIKASPQTVRRGLGVTW